MGMTATAPDNHLDPTAARALQNHERRSIQQIADYAVREQPASGRQDQHAVPDDCQTPREEIGKTVLLGLGEERGTEAIGEAQLEHDALDAPLLG